MMTLLAVILLIAIVLKSIASLNGTRWLLRHGHAFQQCMIETEKKCKDEKRRFADSGFVQCVEQTNGGFFPFGARDYKLRARLRHLRSSNTAFKKCLGWLLDK